MLLSRTMVSADNILTTTSERGNPWTTLLEEGTFCIASRPFGKDQVSWVPFFVYFRSHVLFRPMMQVERAPSPTLQNGRDVSESSCASAPQLFDFLSVPLPSGYLASGSESGNASSIPPDDSVEPSGQSIAYADVVRGPVNPSEPVTYVPDPQNELPTRSLTVFFNPRSRLPASEVFEVLQTAGLDNSSLSCIQRHSSGEIVLTFRNLAAKERFLSHNVVNIRNQSFALQDVDRPLTYLQVFDAPHEMPDATIIQRLAKYCDVLHREPGWQHVPDGVRHYRVRIKHHIHSMKG